MANLSHTQIDRLGDRLGEGSLTEPDLRLLDDYRRSFGVAYETVVRTIREALQLEPTGRPAKSTSSLIEKLRRESIRLSQVQDITGCRIVVADIGAQERVVASLCGVFPGASVIDRRMNPSYGYRAVHVIARVSGKVVEIQVRTMLQSLWAALSEKCSDIIDPQIKYGGGDDAIRERLALASEAMARLERLQDMAGQEDPHVSEQHRQVITEEAILILAQIADMCGMMLAHWGTKEVSSHDPPT
jgi:putative GTP pyrophosphokinase